MAKEEATLLIRIKTAGQQAIKKISDSFKQVGIAAKNFSKNLSFSLRDVGKGFKSLGGRVKNFAKSFVKSLGRNFVITAGDVVAALRAIGREVIKLAGSASQIQTVRDSFTNMAISQGQDARKMLDNMRKLSQGTITDLKLMQQANTALLLGLPVNRLGDMLTIARSSAKATGESMEFMLKSIVTGLGRGSKLILDNLGIVFDAGKAQEEYARKLGTTAAKLTESERKQSFINKALELGIQNVKNSGTQALSTSEKWAIFATRVENLAIKITERLLPGMNQMIDVATEASKVLEEMFKDTTEGDATDLAFEIGRLKGEINALDEAAAKFGAAGFQGKRFEEGAKKQADALRNQLVVLEALRNNAIKVEESQEDRRNEVLLAKAAAAAQERREAEINRKETDRVDDLEAELAFIGLANEEKMALENEQELARINAKLKREQDFGKRQELLKKKQSAVARVAQDKEDALTLKARGSFLGAMSSLQDSNNSILAAAGKAAAIAQIIIATGQSAADGFRWGMAIGGPPVAFAFQGLAIAAGAANVAKVAGVQLAEGGIVPSSSGGTRATIGEGGRAEAVIPLPEDFDPDEPASGAGGDTIININGATLGTPEEARRFAVMIDDELLKLRQTNQSVAFDSGVF